MNGEGRTIAVVGAGIGGLTAALTLAAVGYRIVIVERSAQLSEIGAGIQIAPNAGRVLANLGLGKAMSAAAIEPEAIDLRSGTSGRVITSIPVAAFRERYGFPYHVIHRADLQRILADAVGAHPSIDLRLGATVAETSERDNTLPMRIQTPDGIDEVAATAIVAADGVWSTFRRKVGGSAKPVPTGRTAWRAVVPADAARDLVAMNRTGLWLGPEAHLVHYPIANRAAVNIVAIIEERWAKPGWNAPGDQAELLARFERWPADTRMLLAAPDSWQKYALLTVAPEGPWCDGHIALLGDAAHAMAPFLAQGAAMAIEDAAVLADRLRGANDIPAALSAYAAARKRRVTRVAAASAWTGTQYHLSGPMAVARDLALTLAGERLILDRNNWLYGWRAPEFTTA